MKCPQCQKETEGLGVADTCSNGTEINGHSCDIAFNVGVCLDCLIVGRENVWDYKGVVYILPKDQPPV